MYAYRRSVFVCVFGVRFFFCVSGRIGDRPGIYMQRGMRSAFWLPDALSGVLRTDLCEAFFKHTSWLVFFGFLYLSLTVVVERKTRA